MAKRAFDVVIGTLLCVVATPLIVIGALVAAIALRTGSPFFFQRRIGFAGEELRFPKLRTLPRWMPEYGLKTQMPFDQAPAATRFMRKVHIDELPQLFLVVTGKLSLVGPRPKMPDDVEPVDTHYGSTRIRVPQGCTGLWQISVAKLGLPDASPEYDLFYVANQSLRLDMWILLRTLTHGLHLTKPVTLGDVPKWARRRDVEPAGALAFVDDAR